MTERQRKVLTSIFLFMLLSSLPCPTSSSWALPAEDVQIIADAQYFQTAQKLIREAKETIRVMMFEMGYYEEHPNTPSNLLVRELVEAQKRGVKVEVILEARDDQDRTTKRNRRTAKVLMQGGVDVIYDPLFKTTHAKLMIVDGKFTLVGSTNWTYYALTNNHEVSLLVRSKEVARELIEYFNRVKSAGTPASTDRHHPTRKE